LSGAYAAINRVATGRLLRAVTQRLSLGRAGEAGAAQIHELEGVGEGLSHVDRAVGHPLELWGAYRPTFGLIAVDGGTFTRTIKPSARWLGGVAMANALRPGDDTPH